MFSMLPRNQAGFTKSEYCSLFPYLVVVMQNSPVYQAPSMECYTFRFPTTTAAIREGLPWPS